MNSLLSSGELLAGAALPEFGLPENIFASRSSAVDREFRRKPAALRIARFVPQPVGPRCRSATARTPRSLHYGVGISTTGESDLGATTSVLKVVRLNSQEQIQLTGTDFVDIGKVPIERNTADVQFLGQCLNRLFELIHVRI